MTLQDQLKELINKLVSNLSHITVYPDDWLPHSVWVEEESPITGEPVYNHYILEKTHSNGTCNLHSPNTGELIYDDCHLSTINIDWLITLWERYIELSTDQGISKEHTIPLSKYTDPNNLLLPLTGNEGIYVFVWSCCHLERNVSNEELIEAWNMGPSPGKIDTEDDELFEVESLAPDEFAERINDDIFNGTDKYVRFMKL